MRLQVVLNVKKIVMKLLIILLFVAVFFATVELSYSQLVRIEQIQDPPKILLQLILRNSDGQLVSYVEGTSITQINPNLLNEYLNSLSSKTTIIDDKNYELFQWQKTRNETVSKTFSFAMYDLKVLPIDGKHRIALRINHEAYQVEPGDTISVYWTIFRPVV